MRAASINNILVDINTNACTVVFGGCWCECFLVPFNYRTPSIVIDERVDEQDCRRACVALGKIYASCNA